MLKGEIIDLTSKNKYNVSFFDDDSVDTIRQKIGAAVDIHPDRLHILIGLKLPADYYEKDPRHWEALFERMSYNGDPITSEIFTEYQLQYRIPNTSIAYSEYDRTTWMSKPDALEPLFRPTAEFTDYRIFGVEEAKSFVLSLSNLSNTLAARIPAVNIPIPENTKLFDSFYKSEQFVRFLVLPYDERVESNTGIYFPLLRSNTPPRLADESIRLLQKNSKTLKDLLEIETPQPSEVTIVRTRFYIPWVDTDFGSAIRTRFEQIFYGITVTKETPCITYFTSKDQISRHKFYTEDPKQKKPFVDMGNWSAWWSVKPARNVPALILFRGKSKNHYDRITITSTDMVVATYRPEGNTEQIDHIYRQVAEWIKSLDAVTPFVSETDLDPSRWELQDMSILAKYSDKLEDFDLLRFNCVSSIFDIGDKTKSKFSILRTDHSNNGLSAVEVKILQMMKDTGGRLTPDIVSTELSIPIQNARDLIAQVETRLSEDPRLGEKAFRGYPTLQIGPEHIIISSVSNLERSIKYASLLRFILSNSTSADLDRICPKRAEKVTSETAIVPAEELEVDAALAEEYGDLFGFLEETDGAPVEEAAQEQEEEEVAPQRILTQQKETTTYNFLKARLQKFDPVTFDPVGSKYAKECEQKRQPIVLSDAEIARLSGTPYDIKDGKYEESKLMDTENPDGTFLCPEYWCMRDQIPLQEGQLDKSSGDIRCPVCHGKLQTRSTDNPREYPLIKREIGFVYPGYKDYRAPRNGRQMPCCFKKPRSAAADKKAEDKYYILNEDKAIEPERIAFLPKHIIDSLHLNEKYEFFASGNVRRLMSPNKGFFRAGMGYASKVLPAFLNVKTKIPSPREAVPLLLKCSFFHTWKRTGTQHLESIRSELDKIPEFKDDVSKNGLASIISGIDDAFHKGELTKLEDLEYTAIALNCDVFRVYLDSATLGCMFYTPMVRPRSRGIIVLQNEDELDIIAYTERKSRGFEFLVNIFESPFKRETYVELEKLRNSACKTKTPSYNDALTVIPQLLTLTESDDYEIILDPYGRGQAFYVPSKVILPFQSVPLPDVTQTKVSGYHDITTERLPDYDNMKTLLETAAKINSGYSFKEDIFNSKRQKVEILVESGLRIPVKPVDVGPRETGEVIETTAELGESNLVFGADSQELKQEHREISYSAEMYEFLLFQLTLDIETDYKELGNSLKSVNPKVSAVEPLLRSWFEETTNFVKMTEPKQFLSKIRKPCDESCDGELCGWDGKVCKVKIDDKLQKEKLFHKLLSALTENSKIRAMILDGRTTPFFSTILYLELPHEVIVTDTDLQN